MRARRPPSVEARLVPIVLALAALPGLAAAAGPGAAPAANALEKEIAAGRATFVEQCSVCHTIGAAGGFGPDLKGVLRKETFGDGEPMTEEKVVRTILDGRGRMPSIPLDTTQVAAVMAYLKST